MAIEGSKAMTNCTCAVCRGFEPWATNFAECMITRFIKTSEAIALGSATRVPAAGE